jgi:hypothetical protein
VVLQTITFSHTLSVLGRVLWLFTLALWPGTEMNTCNCSGRKGWPARKADHVAAICEQTV